MLFKFVWSYILVVSQPLYCVLNKNDKKYKHLCFNGCHDLFVNTIVISTMYKGRYRNSAFTEYLKVFFPNVTSLLRK